MYTVTSKIQYDRCRHEYNTLEFEQGKISRMLGDAIKVVGAMEEECDGDKDLLKELKSSDDYKTWVAYETSLKTRADDIALELEYLDGEMNNFQNAEQKGIEQQTTFWCFGG